MSATGCQINGSHLALKIELDADGWHPVAVYCDDWECGVRWPILRPVDESEDEFETVAGRGLGGFS